MPRRPKSKTVDPPSSPVMEEAENLDESQANQPHETKKKKKVVKFADEVSEDKPKSKGSNRKESNKKHPLSHFITILEDPEGNINDLLKKFTSIENKLDEIWATSSQDNSSKFFAALGTHLEKSLSTLRSYLDASSDSPVEEKQVQQASKFITMTVSLISAFISDEKRPSPDPLFDLITQIHDALEFLISAEGTTMELMGDQLASVCETWWLQERASKDRIVPLMITYFLYKACFEGSKITIVQRLYELRNALLLIDFQDQGSHTLKELLLRCMIHPNFLKNKKGTSFLVFLFGLHPPFVDDLHATIKAQIPTCRKAVLEAYAEVYFKAWKAATGPYLLKIEYSCIQDLMDAAIHVSNSQISAAVRTILTVLHSKKKHKGVDGMLVRLYEPILWRSLNVANPLVRRNAAALMIDAFPLQDPDSPQREVDELLQKQFSLLETLLYDDSAAVRSVAIPGVFRILSIFWELIPDHSIRVLISHLLNDLAHDSSSSLVRVTVLEGVRFLLDNHLSQPLLKALLPGMAPLIHDTAEQVRSTFLDLLETIKSIKLIKFYEVVPIDHLLARLAIDPPALSKKITNLLLNSYFPYNKESSIQVKRAIVLVQANPDAAKVFYALVPSLVPLSPVCKFMGSVYKFISKSLSNNNPEEKVEISLLEKLLVIVSSLWNSISALLKTEHNEQLRKYLDDVFDDEALCNLLVSFPSDAAQKAVFSIATHVDKQNIPEFSSKCLIMLHKVKDRPKQEYEHLLACLFAWGFGDQVMDIIYSWLMQPFADVEEEEETTSKRSKRKRKSEATSKAAPEGSAHLALQLLDIILSRDTTRKGLFEQTEIVVPLAHALLQYFVPIQSIMIKQQTKFSKDQLLLALLLYGKYFIHISANCDDLEKDSAFLTDLMSWVRGTFVPVVKELENADLDEDTIKFVWEVTETVMQILTECVTLGLCTAMMQQQIVEAACTVIIHYSNEISHIRALLPIVFKLIYQLYTQAETSFATKTLKVVLQNCPEELLTQEGSNKYLKLGDIFSLHQQQETLPTLMDEMFPLVLDSIEVPEGRIIGLSTSLDELEPIAQFILGTVSRSGNWVAALSSHLSMLLSSTGNDFSSVWRVLEITSVLVNQEMKRKPDMSPLHNCLLSIVSNIPDSDTNPLMVQSKTLANYLLKKSFS